MANLAIGTEVKVNGYAATVIANSDESRYGYCPEGQVIVELASGRRIADIFECEAV